MKQALKGILTAVGGPTGAVLGTVAELLFGWDGRKTSQQAHREQWEIVQARQADRILRRIAFFVLVAPYVWALFDPEAVERYFTVAIASVPSWWQQLTLAAFAAIWGIRELASLKRVNDLTVKEKKRAEAAVELQKRKTHAFKNDG